MTIKISARTDVSGRVHKVSAKPTGFQECASRALLGVLLRPSTKTKYIYRWDIGLDRYVPGEAGSSKGDSIGATDDSSLANPMKK